MRGYKSKIIRKYGTDVTTRRYNEEGDLVDTETKALLGRATRNNNIMKILESQKQGIFLPTMDVRGGDFVVSAGTEETFVVSGTHQEYDRNTILSHVCNLLKCNNNLIIKGYTRVADNRGNLKNEFGEKYSDVPCYLQEIDSELRQYESGIHPDTEYRIYTTNILLEEEDQVVIQAVGGEENFRVVAKDYVSFPNMVVIEVKRDIRT